jgi:hypothetical protein
MRHDLTTIAKDERRSPTLSSGRHVSPARDRQCRLLGVCDISAPIALAFVTSRKTRGQ